MAEKEYIEREALCKYYQERFEFLKDSSYTMVCGGYMVDEKIQTGAIIAKEFLDRARQAPVADVVEVKYGEWKEGHYEGGLLDGVNFDKCNICGHERLIEDVKYKTTYKYCPNCGAKMDRKGD